MSETLLCTSLNTTFFACVLSPYQPCIELHTEETEIDFVINFL